MKTVKTTVDEKICTGCGACVNACPVDAIKMVPDREGFIAPDINLTGCIQCGKCTQVCPALTVKYENYFKPEIYAVRADDEIRKKSSSGGVFTLLAENILEAGGIVYGAAFDENMQLRHISVETSEELSRLRGSKYVQSDTGMIYRDVKQKLDSGREVLFSGTPCQVAALKSYLGNKYENLFTADLLCHGVPSQHELNKYIDELYASMNIPKSVKIKDIRFRDKSFGWSCEHIVVEFENGRRYTSDLTKDNYVKLFFKNLGLRKSCSDCPFAEYPRQGDISLGDFWGISKIDPKLNDGLGTSLVMINSDKGMSLFERAKNENVKCEIIAFDPEKIGNRTERRYPANKNRKRYFELAERKGFNDAVSMALNETYDVGLVSNWYAGNFGGSLTQYALYHTIEDMGYSTLMIERPANANDKASLNTVNKIYKEFPYPPYAVAEQYPTKEQMRVLNKKCDRFIVGSDQLFQYALYCDLGKFVTLDWVDDTKLKIAYAASYGHDYIWGDKSVLGEMAYFIKKFDFFSVREQSGVKVTKENFGVDAEWVLDPVFLCDTKHYDSLIDKSDRTLPDRYIASYILDPDNNKYSAISSVKSILNIPEEVYSELGYTPDYIKPLKDLNVIQLKIEERLHSIKNCDFFVTDSFHGTCFAIIFKKPFISILNTNRGGSRFRSLLSMLHLEHRLIKSADEITKKPQLFEPINYDEVYEILNRERGRCLELLRSALAQNKVKQKTDYDIMRGLIDAQQAKINSLQSKNDFLEKMIKMLCGTLGMGFAQIDSFPEYLKRLETVKNRYAVIISVKDTPGVVFKKEIVPLMEKLGLNISLYDKHWHPYIAVIDCGKVLYEELGDIEDKLAFETTIGKAKLEIISAGFKSSNVSKIIIDGTDYSKNMRGLNIVVYDKDNQCVLDKVCFDTNVSNMTCSRW